MIYRRLDANNTGSIDRKEFERFFAIDPAFSSLSGTVERLRWATEIFQEINIKLMQNR